MDTRPFRRTVVLALLGLSLTGFGRCGASWKLAWQDEFDGPAGQGPDPAAWSADIGTDWGNAQLEFDTERPQNVALDGEGHLVITALRESYQGSAYTSARLLTKEKRVQAGGRVEARIKLPVGQGLWPAFWLLGANIDQVGWPTCGEIDVMEYRGQEPLVIHGTIHGPGYSGGAGITDSFSLPGPSGFDQDFHVFGVEWDEKHIAFEVDGEVYQVVTPESLPAGTAWVFDAPFYVLLNLAVGGTYVGPPDASTVFPARMVVDWVRVYQRDT
jgi:beta-glucanase (GH16 family)